MSLYLSFLTGYVFSFVYLLKDLSLLHLQWIDMIEAFLVEANWFSNGYVPNLEEYLENGVTTAGSYMALVHLFFLIGKGVTKETIGMMDPYPKLFSSSGRILRLWDDLGTATVCEQNLLINIPDTTIIQLGQLTHNELIK